ncbi:poly(A)-specific ribonuclease PARN-like isoform X1 [Telopea speciosissima]|uniref:poly(A)-specific ribonuclease PARN-like isoform X1 n=1 Tax=Telopea speciosissima TaxID=54955 RepID=UPI001CC5579C|nr:poly(A)-specific ribonuclease PARN-like isoform X1 [Telopea speciosissima]
MSRLLQRRFLCSRGSSNSNKNSNQQQWKVKQVTKSNFSEALEEIKKHIQDSDFIAVSSQKSGAFSAPWRRVLPFDTPETAYCKAKDAAEKFQLFQFAVCPFSIKESKVIAFPYNFHLFPRDELNIGMPAYSFSCQTSYLTSMAREGFDFNVCIYDGISYLSRVQESSAKDRIGNPISRIHPVKSSLAQSVADSVFLERTRSRVRHWINACKDPIPKKGTDDALIKSLRKLILGEMFGSRPCMSIDICSERQVELVLEMLNEFSDLIGLIIPDKSGGPKAVRVVLTSSEEDKKLLECVIVVLFGRGSLKILKRRKTSEFVAFERLSMQYLCPRNLLLPTTVLMGFNDAELTFIHSKFLAPLPQSMSEFMCSLRFAFPCILDVNHLLKEIGPLKKAKNLPAAMSYLKRQFFAPLDMEIPHQGFSEQEHEGKNHGHNVLRITHLFAKLCLILKVTRDSNETVNDDLNNAMESYANNFNPFCTSVQEPIDGEGMVWMDNTRKVSTEDLAFLWGFRSGMSAGVLKSIFRGSHDVFSEDFEVRLVDKSCAIVVFWTPGSAKVLLNVLGSGAVGSDGLTEMISEGLRGAGYELYKRICRLGLWESDLAESLDRALEEPIPDVLGADSTKDLSEIYWSNDVIKLEDL